jgi:hypothetical protein
MKNKTQKLLSIGSDAKTIKGEKYNYKTAILYLAPYKESGFNVCAKASPECRKNCIFFTGMGIFKNVKNARIKKTQNYFLNRKNFMYQLKNEINLFIKKCKKDKMIPCIRLNGTSDINFYSFKFDNGLNIFELFPDSIFYDYTNIYKRMKKYIDGQLPKNYHLTFSRKENNQKEVIQVLKRGFNASVVFEEYLPKVYKGYRVINGDKNDLRFLDNKNVVVGLIYKKSKGDITKIGKNSFIIKQG